MLTKKILMISTNYWSSVFQVGSHQLAREFVKKGYEVGFVSCPISPLHLLGNNRTELRKKFKIFCSGGVKDLENRLWAYVPGCLLPPHRKMFLKSLWVHRHWHQTTIPSVVKKVIQNGFGIVDFLYFDTAIQPFWLNQIQFHKSVFRVPDNNIGIPGYPLAHFQLEKQLIRSVDLVVGTAYNLTEQIRQNHPTARHIAHLPNGVSYQHFTKKQESKPPEYQRISTPIAVYVGSIDVRFDFTLMKAVAKSLPQVTFVLIGPSQKASQYLNKILNIHLLGPKPWSSIPAYLQHAQVGLIPFDIQRYGRLVHYINPLKLYEYMASGLPVVATAWDELSRLQTPAYLCRSMTEFKEGIVKSIEQCQSDNRYRDFAKKHNWSVRSEKLLQLLES